MKKFVTKVVAIAASLCMMGSFAMAATGGDTSADGTAYLDVNNGDWNVAVKEATNPVVTGNGTYTASATLDGAFDLDQFNALQITNGEVLFGNEYIVTITEIKVNGKAIDFTADSYTCSQDGKKTNTRVNFYNLYNDPNFEPDDEGYIDCRSNKPDTSKGCIVDASSLAGTETIEVTFTVEGIKSEEKTTTETTTETPAKTPAKTATGTSDSAAKTGDTTGIAVLSLLAVISLAGVVVLKKRNA